jgi:hypothetical protein
VMDNRGYLYRMIKNGIIRHMRDAFRGIRRPRYPG